MPPAGFFSRKPRIGEASPKGMQKLDLGVRQFDEDHGHAMVGFGPAAGDTLAPRCRDTGRRRPARSGTAMATWLRRPIMGLRAAMAFFTGGGRGTARAGAAADRRGA
jgi:hypothetical protein